MGFLPLFYIRKQKFSTVSTVKTVETTVDNVEWLIILRGFSTIGLKNRVKPLVNKLC